MKRALLGLGLLIVSAVGAHAQTRPTECASRDPKPFERCFFPGDRAALHMGASLSIAYGVGEIVGIEEPMWRAFVGSFAAATLNEAWQAVNGGPSPDWRDKAADWWDWQFGWVLAVALDCKNAHKPLVTCIVRTAAALGVWYGGWYVMQPWRNDR